MISINKIIKKTMGLSLMLVIAMLTSCSTDNLSDLMLDGNCKVTAFSVDNYQGTINDTARTVTVRVPETYDLNSMTVSSLAISDGAKSNINEGDKLNLSAPKVMHLTNGSVYLDWTIQCVRDEAKITGFTINGIYNGVIDQNAKTIAVYIPESEDITALVPTITYSKNATVSPLSGVSTDFTSPIAYTVNNNTATATYTVTVTKIGKPSALYVGLAGNMSELNNEEKTACEWMLANISNSIYVSFDDIKNGTVDLSQCKVIWWHFHKDGGVDGKKAFEAAAPAALNAAAKLREYYNNGGSFLFTRYATNMPAEIGAVANEGCPNNCWGQFEDAAETTSGPWSFLMTGHKDHALYQNLVMNSDNPNDVYTCEAGYRITNSTAQWHIGADWGGYADYGAWRSETGGIDLGYGGDGAIVAWEFPATGSKGGIICIGSGCYDWYSIDPRPTDKYHSNVSTMTKNAFNYLMKK